jgi:hypothetical protein
MGGESASSNADLGVWRILARGLKSSSMCVPGILSQVRPYKHMENQRLPGLQIPPIPTSLFESQALVPTLLITVSATAI